jgi:thioredoxin-related protein
MNRHRLFFGLLAAGAFSFAGIAVRADEATVAKVEKTSPESPVPLPENLRKGLEEARKTGRDVLAIINISDLAGWCERMRADIVEQPAFVAGAAVNFVAVNLDFPQKTKRPEEEHRRNLAFARKYNVTGFPVVLLLDSAGRAYARTGYTTSDVREYLAHLDAFKKNRTRRDQLIAKAHRNKGDIRADLLSKALRSIDGSLTPGYPELFEELRAIDPADRSGALLDYDISLLIIRAGDAARTARSPAAGLWEYDAFIAAHPGMPKGKLQRVMVERFAYLDRSGADGLSRTARHERLLEKLTETLALAPSSELAPKIHRLMAEQKDALEKLRVSEPAESETK